MIVQLIGTKYVQICEAVWAESLTQNTNRIRDGLRDAHTDMNPMFPVRSICPAGDNKIVVFQYCVSVIVCLFIYDRVFVPFFIVVVLIKMRQDRYNKMASFQIQKSI